MIGAARFIEPVFIEKSTPIKYFGFKSSYYITYFLGTIGYIIITLGNLSLLDVDKIRNIYDVIIPIIFIATFILFQISFIKIHKLFKKQSNLETNN